MNFIKYTNSSQVLTQSGSVQSDCNQIIFINIGQDDCNILGYTLKQGQQFSMPGNVGEIDETNYNIKFSGTVTDARILVVRKIYK